MKIARITFSNYRSLRDVELTLEPRTVLIGGNGTGKTSVLEALDKAFGSGRRSYGFREQDLFDADQPLAIDFEIRPDDNATFSPEEHALFETHVDVEDDSEVVLIRVAGEIEEDGVFRTRGHFRKCDGEEDGALDSHTRSEIGFFFLGAARDGRREFDDRGGLWARLSNMLEEAHDPLAVETLTSDAGRELVEAVLGEDRLEELAQTVELFVGVLPTDIPVEAELRATSVDFRGLLRGTNLLVGPSDQLRPLAEQSTGLQSLALFGLFRAFLDTAGGKMLAVGLEEPEVHLSPHVGRSLVKLASQPGNQVIFTTHSPAITDTLDVSEIRVLQNLGTGTTARSVNSALFDTEELARLQREMRHVGTEFLFARAVLLCEGASELGALPEFAKKIDLNLDLLGITIVPVDGGGFEPFLKLLGTEGFNIPYCVVCDNDHTMTKLCGMLNRLSLLPAGVSTAEDRTAIDLKALSDNGFFTYASGDLEAVMVNAGGYDSFERAANTFYGEGKLASSRERFVSEGVDDEDVAIIHRFGKLRGVRKPELAAEAARSMTVVPNEIAQVLRHVGNLASRSTAGK